MIILKVPYSPFFDTHFKNMICAVIRPFVHQHE